MNADQRPEESLVSRAMSAVAVEEDAQPVVHSDPEIMGGTPVFFGTRVPLDAMFDYLAAGDSLDRFPTVHRQQATEALELARVAVLRASGCPHP